MKRILEESLIEVISTALTIIFLPIFILLLREFVNYFIKVINLGAGL